MTAREAVEAYRRQAGDKRARIVARWIAWLDGPPTDAAMGKYLLRLEEDGYAPGTVDLHRRTIAAFYRSVGMRPPRARSWRYDYHDARRPAVSTDLIRRMVAAATSGALLPVHASMLALSTIYGMRVGELSAVRPEDILADRIYIRTEKAGDRRWCWIPEVARTWILPTAGEVTDSGAAQAFGAIWSTVAGERPPRVSWHAVRRSLVRDLLSAGCPDRAVMRFLRWRGAQDPARRMLELYGSPTSEATGAGEIRVAEGEAWSRDYDAPVWDAHPYAGLWRADSGHPAATGRGDVHSTGGDLHGEEERARTGHRAGAEGRIQGKGHHEA